MKEILKKYKIRPIKKLGQNFLIDKEVLRKIIQTAKLSQKDIILEIGPGLGVLTLELAKKVKKVIAIEKDKRMCEVLKKILKNYKPARHSPEAKPMAGGNVEIINKDILNVGHSTCLPAGRASYIKCYKLIANLPYYITSPVIRKFLEAKNRPELMVLMVQKEVAQRICAQPPKMSILSIAVQFYSKPEIISYISKKSFYPQPKVDSAIIKITPKPTSKINTEKFFNLIKKGFSSKRKMLKNNLEIKESVLKELGLNPNSRAENLSIKDWLNLFHKINFIDIQK